MAPRRHIRHPFPSMNPCPPAATPLSLEALFRQNDVLVLVIKATSGLVNDVRQKDVQEDEYGKETQRMSGHDLDPCLRGSLPNRESIRSADRG